MNQLNKNNMGLFAAMTAGTLAAQLSGAMLAPLTGALIAIVVAAPLAGLAAVFASTKATRFGERKVPASTKSTETHIPVLSRSMPERRTARPAVAMNTRPARPM
jgi:hypothetical protein